MSATLEKFVLNTSGVRELLFSSECVAMLTDVASSRCPDGCVVNAFSGGKSRPNVSIGAEDEEAIRDNLENNTLLRSIS